MRARAISDEYHARFLKWAKVEKMTDIVDVNYKKVLTALQTAEDEHAKKKSGKAA